MTQTDDTMRLQTQCHLPPKCVYRVRMSTHHHIVCNFPTEMRYLEHDQKGLEEQHDEHIYTMVTLNRLLAIHPAPTALTGTPVRGVATATEPQNMTVVTAGTWH